MSGTIFVKARPELGNRVALWERDPAHPNGEIFVWGTDVYEVGQTERVMERLVPSIAQGGTLVRVEPPRRAAPVGPAVDDKQLATTTEKK